MSYNPEFFEMYRSYLQETNVRLAHEAMIRSFSRLIGKRLYPCNVVDLGCGLCEWHKYGFYDKYVGVDMYAQKESLGTNMIVGDYRRLEIANEVRRFGFDPTIFVSLFSMEACLSADEKYKYYEKLFSGLGSYIIAGCVSGFYYKGKEDQELVEETGGITSYQTIEDIKKHHSSFFTEFRTCIEVPSKMFGPNVIEVWKFFVANRLPAIL